MKDFLHFFDEKFGHFAKKQYFCTAVPVIPLPDMMLVMNPGFLFLWLKLNDDMPKWLAPIDPFDTVCEDIRKEMGWK